MRPDQRFLPYGVAFGSTAVAFLLSVWLEPLLSQTIGAFFDLAIIFSTWYSGFKPGLVAVILSTVAIDGVFLDPPYRLFLLNAPQELLRLGIFLTIACVINRLTSNLQKSKKKIEQLNQQLIHQNAEQLGLALSALYQQLEQRQKEALHIQILFNTSFDGIVILDKDGQVLEANPRFAQMLGYTPEETATLSVFDWEAYFSPEETQQLMQDFITVKSGVFETRHRRKDGSTYDVEISINVVEQQGEILRFCVCRDITERKQAQIALQHLNAELEYRVRERTEELKLSEEKYRQIVETASEGIWVIDAQSNLNFVNPQMAKMLGYTVEEMMNQSLFTFMDQEWQTLAASQFEHPLEHISAQHDFKLRCKDGSDLWAIICTSPICNQQGQFRGALGMITNISARKHAEITLLQKSRQEKLLWSITQSIRQSLDLNTILNTAVTEVRQTLQSDRAAVYHFNPDFSGNFVVESVAEGWIKLVEPDVQKVWEDTYLQETQGGRFQNHESFIVNDIYTIGLQPCHIELLEQFQARSYAIFPIFSGENLWGLLAIYQNATPRNWQTWEVELLEQIASQLAIALQQSQLYEQLQIELQERKQATAIIREAERRWRSLLDNVQLIVVGLDLAGNVNYINPFFLKLTGYTKAEVLGKNWFENFLPSPSQASAQGIFSEIFTQNAHPYYRDFIKTKFGEERFIAWNNTLLQDSQGNTLGMISIGEDITERQKIEKIKDEFIGIVSHEIRTPLTSISMSLGLLKAGIYPEKSEKFRRMIEIASIDTHRLANLVNDILDLERLESGRAILEKTICKAADLMQQAIDGIQAIADQQHIRLTFTPTDVEVWAAADAIGQTLTNLLSNAIKFSPPHSTIHLSAEPQKDRLLFQVRDHGRGIPADKLELIFGRFQQVDASDSREKGGTGLGLAICRSIIERHGGKIWVESVLGEGSTFFFTLPCSSENRL